MILVVDGRTVNEWERRIGEQFRAVRIAEDIDRATLARQASVSLGALANLENGNGSSLRTIVRVAKALGRTDWLDGLIDMTPAVSPMEVLRAARGRSQSRRVRVAKRERS